MRAAKEGEEERTCPRCGKSYNWLARKRISSRVYVYAVHRSKDRKMHQCYLGPEQGYVEVTPLHESLGLELKGLVASDGERAQEYLKAIIGSIEGLDLEDGAILVLAKRFKDLGERLERYVTLASEAGRGSASVSS